MALWNSSSPCRHDECAVALCHEGACGENHSVVRFFMPKSKWRLLLIFAVSS